MAAAVATRRARTVPVAVGMQGVRVQLSPTGGVEPIPGATPKPWRTRVGPFTTGDTLADDGATGFRFTLVLDRSFGKTVEVKKITVRYRL